MTAHEQMQHNRFQQRNKINLQIRCCWTEKICFGSWTTHHCHSSNSVSNSDFLKSRFWRFGTPGYASLLHLWIWCEEESHCSVAEACQNRTDNFFLSFCVMCLRTKVKKKCYFFMKKWHAQNSLVISGSPVASSWFPAVTTYFSWSNLHFLIISA